MNNEQIQQKNQQSINRRFAKLIADTAQMLPQHMVGYGPSSGYPPSAGTNQFGYQSLPGSTMMPSGTTAYQTANPSAFGPVTASNMLMPYPVATGSMLVPGGVTSQAMQSPAPKQKTKYGEPVDPDDDQAKQLVSFVAGKETPAQYKYDLTEAAQLGDLVRTENKVRKMANVQHTINQSFDHDLDELYKAVGKDRTPAVLITDKQIAFKPSIQKTEKSDVFVSSCEEARQEYKTKYAKFVNSGWGKQSAHDAATKLAEAKEQAMRKSNLQAKQLQLPPVPPQAPHDPKAVHQNILDFNGLMDDDTKKAWAATFPGMTKANRDLRVAADRTFTKHMLIFGFIYYCNIAKKNPFIDPTQAVKDGFAQFKADNGFPAQDDWDGTMA